MMMMMMMIFAHHSFFQWFDCHLLNIKVIDIMEAQWVTAVFLLKGNVVDKWVVLL